MTALERLERHAAQCGWRLRWTSDRLRAAPSVSCTELDVFAGKRLLTPGVRPWLMHGENVDARERIAGVVMAQLAPPAQRSRAA